MNIAIIGSGPSAFYAAQSLSKNDKNNVDIIEKLFAPYGLVRYGVAPDHQKTKNIIKLYNSVLDKENVNFFGNIFITKDISLDFISAVYDAVILATGASEDKVLGIKGENLCGVYGSGEFVGWYNDNPLYKDLNPNLTSETAIIIGNGNVALDCARILAKQKEELEGSDISSKNLNLLNNSAIKRIHIVGRRGPKESKFTISELREFLELKEFSVKVNFSREKLYNYLEDQGIDTRIKKNLDIFNEFYDQDVKKKEIIFDFFKTPLEFVGNESLEGIRFSNKNKEEEFIKARLAIKAIGYRVSKIENLEMDKNNNFLLNKEGHIKKNIYATGWAADNSIGVIGTNKSRAINTVKKIISEITPCKTNSTQKLKDMFIEKKINYVTKQMWKSIDKLEEENSKPKFVREKFTNINDALNTLDRN